MEVEMERWRDMKSSWDQERQELKGERKRAETRLRNEELEHDQTKKRVGELEAGVARALKEKDDLRLRLEASEKQRAEQGATHENLIQEHSLRIAELELSRQHVKELTTRVAELEIQAEGGHPISSEERDAIRAEAVKEYRLSTDCQDRKIRFGSGFVKYGFYLARHHLESQRPGESFPELFLTQEIEETDYDWRKYDQNFPMSPGRYLDSFMEDDLQNLTGPWEPYFTGQSSGKINALEDIDEEGRAMDEALDEAFDAPEAEEGEHVIDEAHNAPEAEFAAPTEAAPGDRSRRSRSHSRSGN